MEETRTTKMITNELNIDYFSLYNLSRLENQKLAEKIIEEKEKNKKMERRLKETTKWANAKSAEMKKLKQEIAALKDFGNNINVKTMLFGWKK